MTRRLSPSMRTQDRPTVRVEHVAYGLYRFDDSPRTGKEELIEAVLRVGAEAFLTHDSVLALHEQRNAKGGGDAAKFGTNCSAPNRQNNDALTT